MNRLWFPSIISHPWAQIDLSRQLQAAINELKDKEVRLGIVKELAMPERSETLIKEISDLKEEIKVNVEHYNLKI